MTTKHLAVVAKTQADKMAQTFRSSPVPRNSLF